MPCEQFFFEIATVPLYALAVATVAVVNTSCLPFFYIFCITLRSHAWKKMKISNTPVEIKAIVTV